MYCISVDIEINAFEIGDGECQQRATITISLVDTGLKSRGFHVALLSVSEGKILKKESFDTYGDYTAGRRMIQFIDSSDNGSILVIAVQDDGTVRLTQNEMDYIASFGSRYIAGLGLILYYRSLILIGWGSNNISYINVLLLPRSFDNRLIERIIGRGWK